MENNDIKIIGVRGKAMQALAAAIFLIVLGVGALAIGISISLPLFIDHKTATDTIIGVTFLLLFAFGGVAAIIYGIKSIQYAVNNNRLLSERKEVLVYDINNDEFICYDRKNKEIHIKNGNIKAISGSAIWSARELKIAFIDDNGKQVSTYVGFARNIDGGVLKAELNRYHKPMIP